MSCPAFDFWILSFKAEDFRFESDNVLGLVGVCRRAKAFSRFIKRGQFVLVLRIKDIDPDFRVLFNFCEEARRISFALSWRCEVIFEARRELRVCSCEKQSFDCEFKSQFLRRSGIRSLIADNRMK